MKYFIILLSCFFLYSTSFARMNPPTYIPYSINAIQKKYLGFFNKIDPLILKQTIDSSTLDDIHIVYRALAYKKHNINIPEKMIFALVEALFRLQSNNVKYIIISDRVKLPILVILQNITFQYGENIKTIEKWWKEKGFKTNRFVWAVSRVNKLLKSPRLTFKERVFLTYITCNTRCMFQNKEQLLQWWSSMKDKDFYVWQKDSIAWALNNIDSGNKEKEKASCKILTNLLPKDSGIILQKPWTSIESVKKQKDSLMKWFEDIKTNYKYYKQYIFSRFSL